MKYALFLIYFNCYMIPNYLYSWFLVFLVQALHFYFNVVINNSFNFIVKMDLLLDSNK